MTTTFLWLQLAASAALILGASMYLARSADVIALKTGLGRSFAGVILLATATSLPELGTGVSSIVLIDQPDLGRGRRIRQQPLQPAHHRAAGHLLAGVGRSWAG